MTDSIYPVPEVTHSFIKEQDIEDAFVQKLQDLKYTYRPDIRDRASLEANFRKKFEALNRVSLTEGEFARLLDDLVTPDVFKNSVKLREKSERRWRRKRSTSARCTRSWWNWTGRSSRPATSTTGS